MKEYKKLYQKVLKKENEFNCAGSKLSIYAQRYVDWAELRWEWQPSDGFVFGIIGVYEIDELHIIDDLSLVSYNDFFYIVEKYGKVTPEHFYDNTI